jgi:hypothetical protein
MDAMAVAPVSFSRASMTLGEALNDTTRDAAMEKQIRSHLEAFLRDTSREAIPLTVTAADLGKPEHKEDLRKLQQETWSMILASEAQGEKWVDLTYYGTAETFAPDGTDLVLMVAGYGGFEPGNNQLHSFFSGEEMGDGIVLAGVLADRESQRVVWYNKVMHEDANPQNPEQVFNACKQLMGSLLGSIGLSYEEAASGR